MKRENPFRLWPILFLFLVSVMVSTVSAVSLSPVEGAACYDMAESAALTADNTQQSAYNYLLRGLENMDSVIEISDYQLSPSQLMEMWRALHREPDLFY